MLTEKDVHIGLSLPSGCEKANLINGSYDYYYYGCDGDKDQGWGCGYRSLQSICSWIRYRIISERREHYDTAAIVPNVPSIASIQEMLVEMGDKPKSFIGSREWIGTVEAYMVLDHLYGVPCAMKTGAKDLAEWTFDALLRHFDTEGAPVMVGGVSMDDNASKCVVGVAMSTDCRQHYMLVVDPHYSGSEKPSGNKLQAEGWISWKSVERDFNANNGYNIIMPLYSKRYTVQKNQT